MCTVNLHAVETRCLANESGGGETFDDVLDLAGSQLTRGYRAGNIERDRAGGDGSVPERQRVRLASRDG